MTMKKRRTFDDGPRVNAGNIRIAHQSLYENVELVLTARHVELQGNCIPKISIHGICNICKANSHIAELLEHRNAQLMSIMPLRVSARLQFKTPQTLQAASELAELLDHFHDGISWRPGFPVYVAGPELVSLPALGLQVVQR